VLLQQHNNTTVGYFNGATQQDGACCGAGGVLKLPDYTIIRWTFNCGQGTNTKAEILGAWAAIMLALHLSISHIKLLGDSKVVIAWLENKGSLQVCAIEGWKERIRDMVKCFEFICYNHIPKDFNSEAGLLSKQAFGEPEGGIIYCHWNNNIAGRKNHISIYHSFLLMFFIFLINV